MASIRLGYHRGVVQASAGTRRSGLLMLALALALSQLHAAWFGHVCDDAYISFRYAFNLAHGDGLVFNAGERVMGYSNLLWVLLLAGFERIGVPSPLAARVLGALFAMGTLAALWFHLREVHRSHLATLAALGFLAGNGTFALWSWAGLEGPMFGFFLAIGVLAVVRTSAGCAWRRELACGIPFALAALTRPEGAMLAVAVAAAVLLRGRDRAAVRRALLLVVLPIGAWLVESSWMLAYYGDALPNTYYAKAHPLSLGVVMRGVHFTQRFLITYSFMPALIVVAWFALTRLRLSSRGLYPFVVIAAFLAFFLSIGGDALVFYRMWMWILPQFALLLAEVVDELAALPRAGPRLAGLVFVGLGVAAGAVPSFVGRDARYLRADDAVVRDLAFVGEQLRQLPADTVLAANTVGALSYESRLRMIDMLGLNDRHIARAPGKAIGIPAHESHDGGYVLERQPDLIFLGFPRAQPQPVPLQTYLGFAAYPSDIDLLHDQRLSREYSLANLPLRDGRFCPALVRNTSRAFARSP